MPELPEVHTIASDLKKHILGWRIDGIEIEKEYKVYPNAEKYLKSKGCQINKIGRIGKTIVFKLSNDSYLTFHLAMTGRLLLQKEKTPKMNHQKVQFLLSSPNNNNKILLRFCDMRTFGKTSLLDQNEISALKSKQGPDLVMENITPEDFLQRLQSKNTTLKKALLEQSVVAGLGNIYATDALWIAKLNPESKTRDITLDKAKTLLEAIKKILLEGIAHRGSTLPDEAFVDIFGKPGSHQKYFRIYGRTFCPACKTKIEYKKVAGRGTYFCPTCQK